MAVYDYGTIMKNAISKNEKQQQQLQDEYLKQAAAAAKKSQEASASIKGWADNHNSQYNKFIDYNYTHHYTDTPGYEKIMKSYGVAGNAAAKKASDGVRAGNGGNVDSYASANAKRQRLAFTDAAHEKALSADTATMDRIERLLTSYGVDMRSWGDSLQKGVAQDDARGAQTLAGATAMAETGAGLVKTGDTNATTRYDSDNVLSGTKYSADRSLDAARAQAEASKYAAEKSAEASKYSADRSYDATRYSSDTSSYQYVLGDDSGEAGLSLSDFNAIKKQLDDYDGESDAINIYLDTMVGNGAISQGVADRFKAMYGTNVGTSASANPPKVELPKIAGTTDYDYKKFTENNWRTLVDVTRVNQGQAAAQKTVQDLIDGNKIPKKYIDTVKRAAGM